MNIFANWTTGIDIITGASQGIGAGLVNSFLERGYSIVANARDMTESNAFKPSEKLALVDGDIGQSATVANVVETVIGKFGSLEALVNNAGIFFAKPLTSYTIADLRAIAFTNLEGFIHITQLVIKQMIARKSG
jgi:NADP-dependent 3-hydroxy acid dehydrogenase YdfG